MAECVCLENRSPFAGTVGSNPTSSECSEAKNGRGVSRGAARVRIRKLPVGNEVTQAKPDLAKQDRADRL